MAKTLTSPRRLRRERLFSGFNSVFFLKAWAVVLPHLVRAIFGGVRRIHAKCNTLLDEFCEKQKSGATTSVDTSERSSNDSTYTQTSLRRRNDYVAIVNLLVIALQHYRSGLALVAVERASGDSGNLGVVNDLLIVEHDGHSPAD